VNAVYQHWDPSWEVERILGPPDTLLGYLGDALIRFLDLQIVHTSANTADSERDPARNSLPEFLITKTPSVVGLENFFKLFPKACLLILVRDGRAVVESGVKSFDWDFEQATRDWAAAAHTIVQFKQNNSNANHKYLIVKYEDLFSNTREELRRIFSFLALDPKAYKFDAAESLSITGSCELRTTETDEIHWKPVEKTPHFDPLERWSHWSRAQHERFNWIAGDYLSLMGYAPEIQHTNRRLYTARNIAMDWWRKLRSGLMWVIRGLQQISGRATAQ
jgi:hypothetical protein